MSPPYFKDLWPPVGPDGTMNHVARRKKHSAEDVVRKPCRAYEIAAGFRPLEAYSLIGEGG
jgi:hypothetical protein